MTQSYTTPLRRTTPASARRCRSRTLNPVGQTSHRNEGRDTAFPASRGPGRVRAGDRWDRSLRPGSPPRLPALPGKLGEVARGTGGRRRCTPASPAPGHAGLPVHPEPPASPPWAKGGVPPRSTAGGASCSSAGGSGCRGFPPALRFPSVWLSASGPTALPLPATRLRRTRGVEFEGRCSGRASIARPQESRQEAGPLTGRARKPRRGEERIVREKARFRDVKRATTGELPPAQPECSLSFPPVGYEPDPWETSSLSPSSSPSSASAASAASSSAETVSLSSSEADWPLRPWGMAG